MSSANMLAASVRTNLALNAGSFHAGMNRARKDASATGKALDGLGTVAKRVGAIMATAFATSSIMAAADSYSDLSARVGNAIGDMDGAGEVMSRLTDIALGTYSSLENTAEGFLANSTALREMGLSLDESLDYMEALNNAMVISGAKGDEAARVQKALSDAMIMGSLRGDQLNTVLLRGGRVAQLLADYLGITVSELRNAGAEGLITADVIQNALIGGMETLRAEAEAMPGTFADGFQQIRTGFESIVGSADQATAVSERVSAAMTELGKILVGISKLNFEAFFDGIAVAAETLTYAVAGLAFMKGTTLTVAAGRAVLAVGSLNRMFIAGAAMSRAYTIAIGVLSRALTFVGGPIGLLVTGTMVLAGALRATRPEVTDLTDALKRLQEQGKSTNEAINHFASNLNLENAKTAFDSVSEEMTELDTNIRAMEENIRALQTQMRLRGQYMSTDEFNEVNNQILAAQANVEGMVERYKLLQAEQKNLTAWVEYYNAELEEAKAKGLAVTEEQKKAAAELDKMVQAQNNQNALKQVELQYGRDSVEYAQEELRQKHEIEIAELKILRAKLDGAFAEQERLDALIDSVNASYDAESATLAWANAMRQVNSQISNAASLLASIGGGAVARASRAAQNAVLDAGGGILEAQAAGRRSENISRLQAALQSGEITPEAYAKLMKEVDIAAAEEAALQARYDALKPTSGGGGGRGRSGGGGRGSRLGEAEKETQRISDAYKKWQENVANLGATIGMTELELKIFNAQQEYGSVATNEAIEALVRQEDALKTFQDKIKETQEAFANAFADIVTGAKSFRDVISDILGDMSRQFAKFAADLLFQNLIGPALGGIKIGGKSVFAPPGFANGTAGAPGGIAWVGERGPELVNLNRGAKVYSNADSMRMVANSSNKANVRITLSPELRQEIIGESYQNSVKVTQEGIKQNNRGHNSRTSQFQSDPRKRY